MNAEFVHWLSPLNEAQLVRLLGLANYAKQVNDADGVLIGYDHDVDYDHKNLTWLRARFDSFAYIDRIIIAADAQGQGLAKVLYEDFEMQARARGLSRLVCEVNTVPDNPGSHSFHEKMGFQALEDVAYPAFGAVLRYYEKLLG